MSRAAHGAIVGAPGLHRTLGSFEVLLLTLSCLSPVLSIYGLGSDVLIHAGTGAAVMFAIGIAAAAVWAIVYAELASAYRTPAETMLAWPPCSALGRALRA